MDMKLKGRMRTISYWLYANSLAPIHLKSCKERIAAYEKFTGLKSSELRDGKDITTIGVELKEWRAKYIDMMRERNQWKRRYEELALSRSKVEET